MRCLLSQIGLGIDLNGFLAMEVAFISFVIWIIGFIPGLIGRRLNQRSGPRSRIVPVVFGTITLLTAMVLWAVCIWGYAMLGFGYGVVLIVALFALANTCISAGALHLPPRK